ncbi:MAG TPA: hypothetical protein PLB79_02895, partial [Thermotogota bacterium]|nr:hypothetical protein [Thermotogota bacterium]HPG98978.1 hypothetical protein [Thermotogota bacterium]
VASILSDEAVPLLGIEPLHCTFYHVVFSSRNYFTIFLMARYNTLFSPVCQVIASLHKNPLK